MIACTLMLSSCFFRYLVMCLFCFAVLSSLHDGFVVFSLGCYDFVGIPLFSTLLTSLLALFNDILNPYILKKKWMFDMCSCLLNNFN